ncbi:hypothetical protein AAZX31_16G169600 [Glycine max]
MKIHLQPIVNIIKNKLLARKGKLLSFMGRILLDKWVIHNMLTYIFHVYLWPKYLLKDIGQWMKNFIWSGDVNLRKTVTVAWKAPPSPWIKINTYEAAKGNPGRACCDGLFMSPNMQFLGAFVANIGINCAFMAEIMAAIIAVEKTISENWLWIWLETDSKLLVHAYFDPL